MKRIPLLNIIVFVAVLVIAPSIAAQSVVNTINFSPPGVTNNVGFDFEIAVVESTGLVYVGATGAYGNEVGVIDPSTNSIVGVIPLPGSGVFTVNFTRVNQNTKILYFRQNNQKIAVIDGRPSSPTFNQVLATLSFGTQNVQSFAIDEVRGRLYVTTNTTGLPTQSVLNIIDAAPSSPTFDQTLQTLPFPSGALARGLAVNQVTNKVYLGVNGGGIGGVNVLDVAAGTVTRIAGTVPSFGVIVNEVSNLVYATATSNRLNAVDGATDTLLTVIPMPGLLPGFNYDERLALNRTTGRVYVRSAEDLSPAKVMVVDGDRASPNFNTVLASIVVGRESGNSDIVVDETLNRIITTSRFDMEMSVIDGSSNAVIATIKSPQIPSDVTLNSTTHRAFVASQLNLVQTIDVASATLEATMATGAEAGIPVVNPINHLLYVGRTVATTDVLSVDSSGNSSVVAGLPHGNGRYVFAAVNKNTNRVYVQNSVANVTGDAQFPGFVSVIEGNTNTVIANVAIGNQPFGIAVNETTNKIYSANIGLDNPGYPASISVIDGVANTSQAADTSAFPAVARYGTELAVNENTNKVYFTLSGASTTIGMLDGSTNVATPLPASLGPVATIRVNRSLNRIYVISFTGVLHVLDGANDTEIATLTLGFPAGFAMAVNETTGQVFIGHFSSDKVSVIDGNTNSIVTTIAVGDGPADVAVNELTNRAYVTNRNDQTMSFIDCGSLTVVSTLAVPLVPSVLAIDAGTSRVYGSNLDAATTTGVVVISDVDGSFDALRQAISGVIISAASTTSTSNTKNSSPGWINSMLAKVDSAQAAFSHGDVNAAINKLQALVNEAEAQRGKKLTSAQANRIEELVSVIIKSV